MIWKMLQVYFFTQINTHYLHMHLLSYFWSFRAPIFRSPHPQRLRTGCRSWNVCATSKCFMSSQPIYAFQHVLAFQELRSFPSGPDRCLLEITGQAQKANLIWAEWSQFCSYVIRGTEMRQKGLSKSITPHRLSVAHAFCTAEMPLSIDPQGEKNQLWNILTFKGFEPPAPVPQENNCSHWTDAVGDIRLHSGMTH